MASLVKEIGWHELACHTNFSFLVGASHPHEMVASACQYGYRTLGVADFDGVYGLARSHIALNTLRKDGKASDLKLIFGIEFHLENDHSLPVMLQDTLTVFATSHEGYFNLCALSGVAHRDGKLTPNLPLELLLAADVKDLVAVVPMRGLLSSGNLDKYRSRLALLKEHFNGRVYPAVSRLLNYAEDKLILPIISISRDLGLQYIASQDAFFHTKNRKLMSDVLNAVRMNKTIREATRFLFPNAERSLHSLEELERRYSELPYFKNALEASRHVSESSTFSLDQLRYNYPKEMLPQGYTAQDFLEKLIWEHAKAHYGDIPTKVEAILKHELRLIEHLAFADYFLTVWDIVSWARKQNILCQGRGSAANSAVCFVLGITSVDPATFDVLFERFISVERGDPPDIDVDFEHERREEVIQYVYERYGRDKAAMVANVITFQRKGSIRAVGKALGISETVLSEASKLLVSREFRSKESSATVNEIKEAVEDQNVPWDLWTRTADELYGFPRHLGIHSGGFMLADKPLHWLVAQEPATMPGRTIIQWCKDDIEALGFFKIDLLALGILTAIRKCFELISSHHRRDLTLTTTPQDDIKTYDMICRADTVGTFQIESRAQMGMLPRLKPRCMYDLVIEVAIIRPGPIQGKMIHPYLRRRDGLDPVTFPDERLRPILERTLGIPIFQEQVMRIAMAVGGFSPGEADELRKNIGAFSVRGKVERWIGKLEQGMRDNGISEEFIKVIMEQMHGFAHYGFPESHAASFARLAYVSCYLKCYYPAAFFVSILNSQPMGFYSTHVLIQTAKHLGVEVLPICVRASDWDSKLEIVAGAKKYALRLGLRLVRSLREIKARDMIAARARLSGFKDLSQMLSESTLHRIDLSALAAADALKCFGLDRRSALWLSEAAPFSKFLEDVSDNIVFKPETNTERLQADFYATTTSLGPHPAEILKAESWCFDVKQESLVMAGALRDVSNNQLIRVFGMVIVRQAPPSAHGMLFLTIEDETGLLNLAVTPQVYGRYRKILDGQAFLCILGKLQRQGESYSILVKTVFEPTIRKADVIRLDINLPIEIRESFDRELAPSRNYM
jgi:error-prone DNA polymerase